MKLEDVYFKDLFFKKIFDSGLGVMVQAISPNVVGRERQAEFKASLLYIVSSKRGVVTQ